MRASRLLPALLVLACVPASATAMPYGFGSDPDTVSSWIRTFAVADFDEDGRDDAMSVVEDGTLYQWHAAPDGTLESVGPPALGAPARSITVLDANGDAHRDIAVALASTPPAVVVLLGAGDGSFSNWAVLDSDTNVDQLRSVDIDGDGKVDLVGVSPASSLIRAWRNLGGGSFGPHVDSPGPSDVFGFAAGDLDQDGIADLALATRDGSSTPVLLMHGTAGGSFTLATSVPVGFGEMWSAAIADLDQDGAQDVVIGFLRGPLILWGDGAGGVAQLDTLDEGRGSGESPAAVADFDHDGHLDVVTTRSGRSNFSNWIHLYPGAGGRAFDPVVEHEFRPAFQGGSNFVAIVTGDFDGDGEPDLLIGEHEGGSGFVRPWLVSVVLHRKGRLFEGIVEYTLDAGTDTAAVARRGPNHAGQIVFSSASRLARLVPRPDGTIRGTDAITVGSPAVFHLSDLDGDSDDDLVVEEAGGIGVSLQSPDGSFGSFVHVAAGRWLAFADVDGDGDPDLVSEEPPGFIAVHPNDGSGAFGGTLPTSTLIPTRNRAWASGDWNGDRFEDLAVTRDILTGGTTDPDSITVLLSNGSGAFATHAVVPILICAPASVCSAFDTNTPSRDPRSLAAADLDDDGDLDLVSVSRDLISGSYVTYLNDGSGHFVPSFHAGAALQEDTENLVLTDFDADGTPDVATNGMKDGSFTFNHRLGAGDGQFPEVGTFITALMYGRSLTSGDLDGDGMPELIGVSTEYSRNPNRVLVFYNSTPPPPPTAVTISLASSSVENGRVKLAWLVLGDPARAVIERAEGAETWKEIGAATTSGDRRTFEDASVVAGHTYRYRLAMWEGDRVTRSPEVTMIVPGVTRLGFVSLAPLPAGRNLTVRFTAAHPAPVRVEMFDIGGRRVLECIASIDAAGTGTLALSLDRTRAGLYWLRLTQGAERVQARIAVVH